jgi:hypothetical protein
MRAAAQTIAAVKPCQAEVVGLELKDDQSGSARVEVARGARLVRHLVPDLSR